MIRFILGLPKPRSMRLETKAEELLDTGSPERTEQLAPSPQGKKKFIKLSLFNYDFRGEKTRKNGCMNWLLSLFRK